MTKMLIAFYSRGGTTEHLALAMADGARQNGAEIRLRRARELVAPEVMAHVPGWAEDAARQNALYPAPTPEDADWADAIAFGTPTRFGAMASELKAYIDSLGGLWFAGKLNGKAGAAFAASQTAHGGNETTILGLFPPLAHLGLIIVPAGYVDPVLFSAGTPYGASTVTGAGSAPSADELKAASVHGARLAQVAARLRG